MMFFYFFVLQFMAGFADPCTMAQNPGWPLRNFIALLAYHWLVQCLYLKLCLTDFCFLFFIKPVYFY